MSDDLVPKLRFIAKDAAEFPGWTDWAEAMTAAADEIERLRGENEQLRELARWLVDEDGNVASYVRDWLNNDRPDLLPLFDSIVGGET